MDTPRERPTYLGSLAKTLANLFRIRRHCRTPAAGDGIAPDKEKPMTEKSKLSGDLRENPTKLSDVRKGEVEKQKQQHSLKLSCKGHDKPITEKSKLSGDLRENPTKLSEVRKGEVEKQKQQQQQHSLKLSSKGHDKPITEKSKLSGDLRENPTKLSEVCKGEVEKQQQHSLKLSSEGHDKPIIEKIKLSGNIREISAMLSEAQKGEDEKQQQQQRLQKLSSQDQEVMESLVANLFARVSAIKAAYAQLQLAEFSYDADSIEDADHAVVSEFKQISVLKQSYLKNELFQSDAPLASQTVLEAQIREQRSLLKTYQITTKKLETELQLKGSDILSLQAELLALENQSQALDSKLHPGSSLSALDDLHLSRLNPTHFLIALRYTMKSIRSFVKTMVMEMESAGWDLGAAAGSIQPDVLGQKPDHWIFAFESFVCQKIFSDFHRPDFNISSSTDRSTWDRRQFFDEFTELKFVKLKQVFDEKGQTSALGKFLRAKYLALVHPKMESSFFGNLDQRAMIRSGKGFPESAFFASFAEMARRVWLLHCLLLSFGPGEGSIFQVRRGSRFSDVYMESVADDDDDAAGARPTTVGFTVVPGFRVGMSLIQCKVSLISCA